MDRLLTGARSFNQACCVTGVLLHQGGNFFQYLEGPQEGVAQVYARIQRATSHHGLIELVNGPVEQRHFSAWSCCLISGTEARERLLSNTLGAGKTSSVKLNPRTTQPSHGTSEAKRGEGGVRAGAWVVPRSAAARWARAACFVI